MADERRANAIIIMVDRMKATASPKGMAWVEYEERVTAAHAVRKELMTELCRWRQWT